MSPTEKIGILSAFARAFGNQSQRSEMLRND